MLSQAALVASVVALGWLAALALHRAWLLARFRRVTSRTFAEPAELPAVTVQLPLYNEPSVAARAIEALATLDYPTDKLCIQVLDDSNDETRAIVDREAARWQASGLQVEVLRREHRAGFKAGALAGAWARVRTPLIAIFDADFVPAPTFLRSLVGAFEEPRVGMVQARWDHLERDASLFSRAQATLLDGHFVITHAVRRSEGRFTHFNGTAGIWRTDAIGSAGGWEGDTLTEDLDLSYRAQLAGWRFEYAAHVAVPAELPATISAFKTQQRRWSRGTVQAARKLIPSIWRARAPFASKLEATIHLVTHGAHPAVLSLGLLAPHADFDALGHAFAWLVLGVLAVLWFFYERAEAALGKPTLRRAQDAVLAILLGAGMSATLSLAALRGLFLGTGSFERTPKRGSDRARREAPGLELALLVEWLLAAHALLGVWRAVDAGAWTWAVLLAVYALGFGWVGTLALSVALERRMRSDPSQTCARTSTGTASSSSRSTATAR
jgi:hypothetical protein